MPETRHKREHGNQILNGPVARKRRAMRSLRLATLPRQTRSGDRGRVDFSSRQLDHAPRSGLIKTVPEPAHQNFEAKLARAMAGRDPLKFQRFVENRSYALDLRLRRHNEMKTSSHRIDIRIDLYGLLQYLFDTWV